MNWGYKITFLYLGFVAMILVLVVSSASQKFHLVSEDYYSDELAYQNKIDQLENARNLAQPLQVSYAMMPQEVRLTFPQSNQDVQGTITFYRPSDAKMDQNLTIAPKEDGVQLLDVSTFAKGLWKLQVQWRSEGQEFFQEETLVLR